MQGQNKVRIHENIPFTHCFLYKNKKYPFNFSLFKFSSQYFSKNKVELRKTQNINLIDKNKEEFLNFSDDIIENFIKYAHREDIQLTHKNVTELNYLAKKYEVLSLIQDTKEYISNHHQDLALQNLLIFQNDESFKTDTYEDVISEKLIDYLNDDRILLLNFPILYRIISKYQKEHGNNEIYHFLFKCLDKYGTEASILFSNIDFGEMQTKYSNLLLKKYSKIFDFQFINSSMLKSIYEQQNNFAKNEIENQKNFQTQLDSLKSNFLQKEKEQNKRIKNLEESMNGLLNENKQLKVQIQNYENTITALKSDNETFKNRILNLEKIFNEQIKSIQKQSDKNELSNKNSQIKTFEPISGNELNGIFKYLTDKTGGNIHENGTISVSSDSVHGPNNVPENLLKLTYNTYAPKDKVCNAWVLFDFKNMEIEVSHYTAKSGSCASPKNWVIEISNDGNKWEEIDRRTNCADIKSSFRTKVFDVKPNHFCRYCRFHHIGDYWDSNVYTMVVCNVEFFGRLKEKK